MTLTAEGYPDVLQVCRNGHVITDLLRTFPERGLNHCDRCGASTVDHCNTCGQSLPGAVYVPGMVPLGRTQPPQFCPTCGAAFPWSRRPAPVSSQLATLETLLRRLPRAVRQLRSRHGDRQPFRVQDEHDLSDLLRALLPLHFDDVRPESRTPSYSPDTRTDLILGAEKMALVMKRTAPTIRAAQLAAQVEEDVAYYTREGRCRRVLIGIYDAEALLTEPRQLETAWGRTEGELEVVCVVIQ